MIAGGRSTPFMTNYRPQLFLRTADCTIGLGFPEGTEDASEKMIMPGDNVELVCELLHTLAVEVGTRFTIREGNKTSKFSHLSFCYVFFYINAKL